jgi:DNA-binding NarL/FixJ family response regulator
MLIGRSAERARLDEALAGGRGGQSAILVLRGAVGAGKTSLLDDAAQRATGFQIVRATGAEWEMELPFAGLHQLCGPLLAHLDRLPPPQRDALRTAFGLSAGDQPDRFLVGVAVLGLIAEAAEDRPLLCLIDDVQWLDRSSVQVLSFVARRLQAEPVVLVFAIRDPFALDELDRLPELRVDGLSHDAASTLLGTAGGLLDERVRARILAEARGNPLALLELPRTLSPAALAGGFGLPGNVPLHSHIEASFLQRALDLPRPTRQLLLLSAAEPTGDPALLWASAAQLDIPLDALAPARTAGLLEVGARIAFSHPLLRSAVYRAASDDDRRMAHRALAAATDPGADPERRAWHLAQAALGPDPELADELARLADRAQARGGVAAAAAFLQLSAILTLDPAAQARRSLQAATAKQLAGAPEEALALLSGAGGWRVDEFDRAMAVRLNGQIALDLRRGGDAVPLLCDAARRLEPLNPNLARDTYAEALRAASIAGRFGPGMSDVATLARAAPTATGPARAIDLLIDGLAIRFTDGYAASAGALKDALAAVRAENGRPGRNVRWPWIARRVAPDLFADETWHALTTRNVEISRSAGALGVLPLALSARAMACCAEGDLDGAAVLISEADAIADATSTPPIEFARVMLAGYRGDEPSALETIAASETTATTRGEGVVLTFGEYAQAVLFNALGKHPAALEMAQRAAGRDELMLSVWSLPELVEAAVRSGDLEVARGAMEDLAERTDAAGSDVALGIQARARALLASGAAAEELYREAIDRLATSRFAFDLARAHLLYGEWLRREQRRVDARGQLRASHDMYRSMGAVAFADRAGRELLATGETVGARTAQVGIRLTAQETQIALLARDGLSNPEIATRLFISPRTVQYHLHKVFTKLEISSRNQLHRVLPVLSEAA